MPLTLTVRKIDRPGAVPPPPLRLDGRGAVIGRAQGSDWMLSDERNTVSSRHCEIAFRDGAYLIADSSTNGTYLNGRRMNGPQRLNEGDVLGIGPYEVAVAIAPATVAAAAAGTAFPAPGQPTNAGGGPAEHLLRHAGLRRSDVRGADAEILAAAGALLRQMTAGARAMLAARGKARAEIGATAVPPGPLEAGHTAEQALAGLLVPGSERAASEAFADLEAHQLATLKAMQGAMKATLDRFSPAAIRAKAGAKASGEALWREYESAFGGGDKARDDAFIEVFARELRAAYEAMAARK